MSVSRDVLTAEVTGSLAVGDAADLLPVFLLLLLLL